MTAFTESARFERWWPFGISTAATIGLCMWLRDTHDWPGSVKDLFSATLNISAIMIGFLATAKSIMFSLGDTRRLRDMRNSGHFDKLIGYLMRSTFWAFVMAMSSALNVILYPKTYPLPTLGAWVFSIVATITCFYQVVSLLGMLLRDKGREEQRT